MWLINVDTMELEEFVDERGQKYAILSHRWQDGEVSFRDMQQLSPVDRRLLIAGELDQLEDKSKINGFQKIRHTCWQAAKNVGEPLSYVWIDTCCIDKSSSAELSEAINSMFRWYESAVVCYVYLADVEASANAAEELPTELRASKWFTRGWTLQELLAPRNVAFYNVRWEYVGTKETFCEYLGITENVIRSRGAILPQVTGIDAEILLKERPLSSRSIAQRMCWASRRETTRIEDTTYCLLGIFDVNMPLLYGEGKKAFTRLQAEIIKDSDDDSMFAWDNGEFPCTSGLFAAGPRDFTNGKFIVAQGGDTPYSLTNRGLSITRMATPWELDTYLVFLKCQYKTESEVELARIVFPTINSLRINEEEPVFPYKNVCIFMQRLEGKGQYVRVAYLNKGLVYRSERMALYKYPEILQHLDFLVPHVKSPLRYSDVQRVYGFSILKTGIGGARRPELKVFPAFASAEHAIMLLSPSFEDDKGSDFYRRSGVVGTIDISAQNGPIKIIKLGFDFHFEPVCYIVSSEGRWQPYQSQLYSQEVAHYIHSVNYKDTKTWSAEVPQKSGVFAFDLRNFRGVWAIRGKARNSMNKFVLTRLEHDKSVLLGVLWLQKESRRIGQGGESLVWHVSLDYPGSKATNASERRYQHG